MYIYLIMLSISLILAIFIKKDSKRKYIIPAIPFFLISAFRYDVGTDYFFRYVPDYLRIYSGYDVKNLEIGFKLFLKICTFVAGNQYQIIFIITSLIIILGIFSTIYKYSVNPIFSIILFFISGYFFNSLNLVRQYVAIAILLYGYKYLVNKENKKWFVCCIIAIFVHSSSIVGVFLIFLRDTKRLNWRKLIVLIAIVFILKYPIRIIIENVMSMSRFNIYINSQYDVVELSITDIIQNLLICFMMYYSYEIRKNSGELNGNEDLFINLQIMTILCVLLGNTMYLLTRLKIYFQIFQLISIPYFIKSFHFKTNRRIISVLILILFTISLVRSNIINNDNDVVPYQTIWNKEKGYKI